MTPVDVHVSTLYGQGGVRFITSAKTGLRGYVETAAGIGRLRNGFGGIGSPTTDIVVNAALRFFDRTDPLATLGTGVILQGGPVIVDFGYRFTRIFAGNSIAGLLTGGNLDVNQVRIGVGVRF